MPADPDAAAFADQDILARIAAAPNEMAIEIDRLLIERDGLSRFVELAWHTVEGSGTYRSNWHIDAICDHLMGVSAGHIKRLAINNPPRHMKSTSCAVMWPAWDWIKRPDRRFLFASYAHNLSIRDSVKCRRVLSSPWFKSRWDEKFTLTSDQNTKIKFDNDHGGFRMATSVDGQLTGDGGDFCCVDDPHNVIDGESEAIRERTLRWWTEAMPSRLNDQNTGAFVVIMQRVHTNDIMGHILKHMADDPYEYLCLPEEYEPDHPHRWFRDPRKEVGELLWPEHIGPTVVRGLKSSLGPYAWAAQYQMRPAPREGGLFKRSWFPIKPDAPLDCEWATGWDLAATAKTLLKPDPDWTARVKIGKSRTTQKFYIESALRWRDEPNVIRALILSTAMADGRGSKQILPKDPAQAGKSQSQDLAMMLSAFTVIFDPQSGDKVMRAMPLMAQAAAGNVILISGDWNEDFLTELTSFPTGAHDDQVDAAASAYNGLVSGNSGIIDFYRHKIADDEAAAALLAAPPDPDAPSPGSMTINTSVTTNLAEALLGVKKQS